MAMAGGSAIALDKAEGPWASSAACSAQGPRPQNEDVHVTWRIEAQCRFGATLGSLDLIVMFSFSNITYKTHNIKLHFCFQWFVVC